LAASATKADEAIWALARQPKTSLAFLKDRLSPVAPADPKLIVKLIVDLDSNNFALRDKARRSLEDLGDAAEAAVRKYLDGAPPLEVRQRLAQFLDKIRGEVIRKLRAIEVLEHIGNGEARQLLDAISKQAPIHAWRTLLDLPGAPGQARRRLTRFGTSTLEMLRRQSALRPWGKVKGRRWRTCVKN